MATSFVQQVLDAGVPQSYIDQQATLGKGGTFKGSNLDAQDVAPTIAAYNSFKNSPGQLVQSGIQQLNSQQYQFDPQQYLPAIQGQADSIYTPQAAQLEAIRQLQNASAADTRVQTEKDFAKRMQQETEAINRRGSFFSGGAIQNEQDIRSQQSSALYQQDLQAGAANFSNLASQAQLAAEKTQFIQDRLVNSESGAYARWTDQRNFSMQALTTQYQVYSQERDFARNVFESDRSYKMDVKRMDMQEKQFKQQYAMDDAQFKMAKEQFNLDMKVKNLSYDQALSKFKKTSATTNYGIIGADENGNDKLESYRSSYSTSYNAPTKSTDNNILGTFSNPGTGLNDLNFGF